VSLVAGKEEEEIQGSFAVLRMTASKKRKKDGGLEFGHRRCVSVEVI
jgi:hypothetical protein